MFKRTFSTEIAKNNLRKPTIPKCIGIIKLIVYRKNSFKNNFPRRFKTTFDIYVIGEVFEVIIE